MKFSETYKKHKFILRTENKPKSVNCLMCGKQIKSISALTTHLLRKHKVDLDDYIKKYFVDLDPQFKVQQCGFCKLNAMPTLVVDFSKTEYHYEYDRGFWCRTNHCKNDIALDFFGKPLSECQSKFNHIGSNTRFLATLYRKDESYIRQQVKSCPAHETKPEHKSDLNGFILRYGKKEGRRRYEERCKNISKKLHIEWYISKYGIEEGTKKYEKRFHALRTSSLDINNSKNQKVIYDFLKEIDPKWEYERFVGGVGIADMVNKKDGIALEYFGDYWHCNPKVYGDDYFNKSLKMTSIEKQRKDIVRLNKMLAAPWLKTIIVVWERSFIQKNCKERILKKIVRIIKQTKSSNKKRIIWI